MGFTLLVIALINRLLCHGQNDLLIDGAKTCIWLNPPVRTAIKLLMIAGTLHLKLHYMLKKQREKNYS
jgi:hypothetical protein